MKFISQIVTAASGSVRGCVFSRNRSGAYIRGRGIPVNPGSQQQNLTRTSLATLIARWTSTLTSAQRTSWNTWALNTPHSDALGQSIILTGQNAYVSANTLALQAGLPFINAAPTVFAGAVLTPPALSVADVSAQTLAITFSITDLWRNQDNAALLVFQGRPQNPSINYFKGPYRFAEAILGSSGAPWSPPYTMAARFPFALGQNIHVQFRALLADGRISSLMRSNVISVP